jgi:hypothetical protein
MSTSALEVRRDVCLASYACGGNVGARMRLVPIKSIQASRISRTHSGLTVLISAKHGAAPDWTNLAHWTSACMFLAAAAATELPLLGRFGQRLVAYADKELHVALPQVLGNRTSCGGNARIPALVARGRASEMFSALAFATAHVVVDALRNGSLLSPAFSASPFEPRAGVTAGAGSSHHWANANRALLLCPDIAAPRDHYTCFEGLVRARWSETSRTWGMGVALEEITQLASASSRQQTGQRMQRAMRALLAMPPPAPVEPGLSPRRVVLLTRRTQSAWVNRHAMTRAMRQVATLAGARFTDAGDAEDLGLTEDGCYRAAPQVELWAGAWLVLSVVGAHESNVIFMSPESAGLLESLNCGHHTQTYATLAAAAGVPYAAARETRQLGHDWLAAASAPVLAQACQHLSLPPTCSAAEILAAKPHLYDRRNCTGKSAKALLWLNMPRMHLLSGESADVIRGLRDRLGVR